MNKYRQHITISAVALGVLVMVVSLYSFSGSYKQALQLSNQNQQLLDESWDSMPGGVFQNGALLVTNQNRAIRTLEGTYFDNPSVMLYGKHIRAAGDVSVEVSLSKRIGTATFSLFSKPPYIMDEQMFRYPFVEVGISDTEAIVKIWQKNTIQPTITKTAPRTGTSTAAFVINRTSQGLRVIFDGKTTFDLPGNTVLSGSELWFGAASTSENGSWQLDGVAAKSLDSTPATVVDTRELAFKQTSNGLQATAAAKRTDFKVGAAVSLMPAVSDPLYGQDTFGGDFGQITTENALKMQFVQPRRGVYDFAEADALVSLAKKHSMSVHGHALVFGEANPAWLASTPKAEVESVMIDHVKTTVGHFKNSIYSWDVINEPLADYDSFTSNNPLRAHIWMQAIGSSYIEKALRAAHEANPNAELWINDFGLEGSTGDGGDTERWDAMLALVSNLKSKGVPLTGVGFQSHVYEVGDEISAAIFESRLAQLEKLGLKARVSELDVHNDSGRTAQAAQFETVVKACFTHKNCTSVNTWGVNDAYGSTGSIEDEDIYSGDGLLWDDRNVKLPAYDSFKKALSNAGAATNLSTPTALPTTNTPVATPIPSPSTTPTVSPVATSTPTPTSSPDALTPSPTPSEQSTDAPSNKRLRVTDYGRKEFATSTEKQNPTSTDQSPAQSGATESTNKRTGRFSWLRRFFRWIGFRFND